MKKYFKILLLLVVAFVVSDFGIKNIFLVQSPKLNPFFTRDMIAKVSTFWQKTTNFIASTNPLNKNIEKSIGDTPKSNALNFPTYNSAGMEIGKALTIPLTKISQGIYAGEKNDYQVYEIRTSEFEYLEYTFNVNGKEIKIKVPKDQQPPSQDFIEALYK